MPQKYECVFMLSFCDKLSMKVLGLLKEQVLHLHILLYQGALLVCINLCYYVLQECLTPCLNFILFYNSELSFKKEINIFLLELRGKYVLCLLFFKKIFKISKLFVCWIFVALFYYFVCTSGSSQIKEWFH